MKSASGWNGKNKWMKTKLQVGEICKWVKQEKQVGENESYKLVKSASGWNGKNKWVETTTWKKEMGGKGKFHPLSTKMEQIYPHFRNVNKFTHCSSRFYPPQRVLLLMWILSWIQTVCWQLEFANETRVPILRFGCMLFCPLLPPHSVWLGWGVLGGISVESFSLVI